MTRRPALLALADRAGILREYTDTRRQRRCATDETREALVAALGFDASTEDRAARAMAELDAQSGRLLDPAAVVTGHVPAVRLKLPPGASGEAVWTIEFAGENGLRETAHGQARVTRSQRTLIVPLAAASDAGYYDVHAALRVDGMHTEATQRLIVAPASCEPLGRRMRGRRFGIAANLYATRGNDDWGFGDFAQLEALIDYTAAAQGEFVGINPLHALRNRGQWVSPYSPTSRLFRNFLYIDIERVPGFAQCAEARALAESPAFRRERERLRGLSHIDHEGVARIKVNMLRLLHECFMRTREQADDAEAFERFRERHGTQLVDFATFSALEAHFVARDTEHEDWRRWPEDFRDPRSPAVLAFRNANAREVSFHEWLQFEADRQLEALAGHAARSGLRLGLFGDLAIGSAPGAADHWAFPGLFVSGASIGAPPDDYSETGQDWGLPPVHPLRLAEDGFDYWRFLIRNALAHTGALRIDHVMGLFRQFWIPEGRPGTEGAYVRFPADALLGILALESRRARAVIIGEDLGTVPRGLPARLARMEILSTRVLYFERERTGAFRASRRYSRRTLVSANTHDAPPLAGFWAGRDLELRRSIGALDQSAFEQESVQRERARSALLARLSAEHILPAGARPGPAELRTAVHRFLAHTPAPLLGVSLDDLAGETEPVNVPGVSWLRHHSWTRRSRRTIESLATDPDATRALSGVRERTRRR